MLQIFGSEPVVNELCDCKYNIGAKALEMEIKLPKYEFKKK